MSHECGCIEWLPAAHRQDVPWKNGGGLTREIVASPAAAGLEHFDWRISTAEVRTAGPFSAFPGVDRTLCVLDGRLSLSLGGRAAITLSADSAPLVFAGDVAAHGVPVDGRVIDLNVMVRRGAFDARVGYLRAGEVREILAPTVVLLALGTLSVAAGQRTWALKRWDALRLAGPQRCGLESPPGAAAYLIEIWPVGKPE